MFKKQHVSLIHVSLHIFADRISIHSYTYSSALSYFVRIEIDLPMSKKKKRGCFLSKVFKHYFAFKNVTQLKEST